ncbi:MAG TPA: type II secretion system protein [Thermoanaerobaculia bacterium]|jgi:prepilin-type N-terminal cleavage/methylation domain-containing protein
MRQRGMSLVEVMVALAILGLVIMSSLAVFVERNRRLQQASELVLAYQALSNETELLRRVPYSFVKESDEFMSDTTLLKPLKPFTTSVKVVEKGSTIKVVTIEIAWKKKTAKLEVIRTSTGGENLW